MRAGNYIASAFVAFLVPALSGSALAASDPTGIWLNDTGRGAVEIKHCGDMLCGNVVWVQSAADADGCGKQIIGDVAAVGGGRWDNGWIYSPERGRKYNVELTPLANGDLKVLGYAGMKFLSKTMIWKRAPQDLQLCGQPDNHPGNQSDAKANTPAAKKPDVATAALAQPAAPVAPKTAPAEGPSTVTKEASAEPASPAPAADTHKSDETKAPAPSSSEATADAAAKNDPASDEGKADDIGGALGKIKIGDLQLDKVLTRTKSGKCKLDLPWVKVTIDCEQ